MRLRMTPILAAAWLLAAIPDSALAQPAAVDAPPTLSVVGEGLASAAPDVASVRAGVQTAGETAAAALSANTDATGRVIAALKSGGVAARDIQTANFSVQPRYADYDGARPDQSPRIVGYIVTNEVVFSARDLDALGGVLDTLITAGANQINGIAFIIDDEAGVADRARRAAVEDARRKAELYAEAAGVRLLRVLRIEEAGRGGPIPFGGVRMEAMARADVPIERGENDVRANVTVVWEIIPEAP